MCLLLSLFFYSHCEFVCFFFFFFFNDTATTEIYTLSLHDALPIFTNVETTHYLIGSCVGPHPYPELVRVLQSVIGREAREQMLEAEGRLPEAALACVGGGSNAIGLFAGFLEDAAVRLVGVEA